MSDCVFCGIVEGKIPSHKIYEDENVLAFLDIAGDYLGHTLVIPKKHFVSLVDCPTEVVKKIMEVVQKIGLHYVNNCGFGGFNVICNNGACSGQVISHLHFHIIPHEQGECKHNVFCEVPKQEFDFPKLVEKLKL